MLTGLLTLVAGLLLCFGGYLAMRLLLALWGAYVGFVAGAVGYALVVGQPLLADGWAWLASGIVALVFALLSYAFYAAAVVIAVGGLGYALGAGVAALVGLEGWAAVFLGVVAAALLVWLSLAARLPHVLLAVLSAVAGAGIALDGVLLLAGAGGLLEDPGVLLDQWWWGVAYLALAIAGIVVQVRSSTRRDLRTAYQGAPAQR